MIAIDHISRGVFNGKALTFICGDRIRHYFYVFITQKGRGNLAVQSDRILGPLEIGF